MKRHMSPIADFFRSRAAEPGNGRRVRKTAVLASARGRPLFVVFVALAVLASSIVFASTTSAHDVVPEYSCTTGTLDGDQCVESADPIYRCTVGKLKNGQCEVEADPTYSCDEGTVTGDQCRFIAAPTWSCASGEPDGANCEVEADPTYSCDEGTVTGDQCLESADPIYSCNAGTLDGANCEVEADPTYSCDEGTVTGDQCRFIAAPTWSCASGELSGTNCKETADPTYSCSAGTVTGDQCLESADLVYSCSSGTLEGANCKVEAVPTYSCDEGTVTGDQCRFIAAPTWSCASGELSGTNCKETADPTYSCDEGTVTGDQCLESADLVYSCSSGTLDGSQCLVTTGTTYSCTSGTLNGTNCVTTTTTAAVASCSSGTLNNGQCLHVVEADPGCPAGYTPGPFDTCYKYTTPTYSCTSGTLSGANCITTTTSAATASCPSGYQLGIFNICYKYTAASSDCPSGFPPPAAGLCLKYSAADASCETGYKLSAGTCTKTTRATASCDTGYTLDTFEIEGSTVTYCYKDTPADAECETGFTLSAGTCTKITRASTSCPSGFPPPAAGLCLKYSAADASCETGYKLSAGTCTKTTRATASCDTGYTLDTFEIEGSTVTYCYKDTPADAECETDYTLSANKCTKTTPASSDCPAGFPPPAAGLCLKYSAADASCETGYKLSAGTCTKTTPAKASCATDYTLDSFDLEGSTVTYCYKDTPADAECETGFTLSAGTCTKTTWASSSCPSGFPPPAAGLCLKYSAADASCEAGTPSGGVCDHDHDPAVPSFSGLASAASVPAGSLYSDSFTVTPATSTVLASGAGCGLSQPSATGDYTLTAGRSTPGKLTCEIAAVHTGTATAAVEVTFTPATLAPTAVEVECTTDNEVVVSWYPGSGADEYKVAVTEHRTAPARPSTETYTVVAWSAPGGQKQSLTADGILGREYSATVTGVNTTPDPDVESAPAQSAGRATCNGIETRCQADGGLTTTWARDPRATRYRLQISVYTGNQKTTLAAIDINPPDPPTSTITHTHTNTQPGKRHEAHVTALNNNTVIADYPPAAATCELPPCKKDGALLGRAGLSNHRHGSDDCHIHESHVPSCSVSEDRAYTIHTNTAFLGVPTHVDGVVLACHPGRDQGVISPQPLTVACGTDGKVRANWQSAGASRFEVEGDLTYSGTSQTKTWDGTPLASYTIRVRALWDRFQQDPLAGPWTIRKTTTCPRFIPQRVNLVCDDWRAYQDLSDSGSEVVTMTWEPVTGATKYRISGDFNYVGPPLQLYTWQGMEGESYSVRVEAYSGGGWSAPSRQVTSECYRHILRHPPEWDSPNSEELCVVTCHSVDPDPPALVSRSCEPVAQTGPSTKTIRDCTIVWNETITVRTNSAWDNVPIVSHTGETTASTLGAFIAALLLGGPLVKVIIGTAATFTGANIAVFVYRDLNGDGWVQMNGEECVKADYWSPQTASLSETVVNSTGLHTTTTTHAIKHCVRAAGDQVQGRSEGFDHSRERSPRSI